MDDSVTNLANTIALMVIAALNAWVAWMSWQTKEIAKKTEVNTNHMREQLVERTGEAAHAAGRAEMREEKDAEAATLAKGQKQGRTKK